MGWRETYKNNITAPAARIRRVVFDHAASTAPLVYSHASSIVISLAADAMLNELSRDPRLGLVVIMLVVVERTSGTDN